LKFVDYGLHPPAAGIQFQLEHGPTAFRRTVFRIRKSSSQSDSNPDHSQPRTPVSTLTG
jgi:hypothetical protein